MAIRNTLTLGAFTLPGAGVWSPESGGPADIGEPCGQLPQPRFLGGERTPEETMLHVRAPRPVRLGGRARCPHRAAAPSARCAAWHRAHHCALG